MRSYLLILGTLLLTIGGFLGYQWLQPVPKTIKADAGAQPRPVSVNQHGPSLSGVKQGDRPWIRNIDRLGRLTSEFKADEYLPQGGGHVHVIQPRAQFFQYSGGRVQKIAIEGETGDFEVQEPAGGRSATFEKGSAGAPKRGRIKRGVNPVTIRMFPDILAAGPAKDHVSITLTTDNLKFDNETFEISTDAIVDDNGKVLVPPDQVPIHVTGDYEFEGKGLFVRWNDLEGRLEYLEVPHGERLTITHPAGTSFGGLETKKGANTESAATRTTQPVRVAAGDMSAVANTGISVTPPVQSGIEAPPATAAPTPATTPPARKLESAGKGAKHGPQPPYRANFERDIRITQGMRGTSTPLGTGTSTPLGMGASTPLGTGTSTPLGTGASTQPGTGTDEKQMATAATMYVDFLLNQSRPTTQPTTAPSSAVKTAVANTAANGPQPSTTQPADHAPAEALAANSPIWSGDTSTVAPATEPVTVASATTEPSTQPSDGSEPVNVYWVGKLVVQPNPDLSVGALQAGQSIVHLLADAEPVHVTRDSNDIVCGRLDYFSPEGNVSLFKSPEFPQVVLRQLPAGHVEPVAEADPATAPPDDAVITSEHIDYSGVEKVAVLTGTSEAKIQLKPDPTDPSGPTKPGLLDLRWQRLGRIYFQSHLVLPGTAHGAKSPQRQLAMDHAHLEGDVDLQHPQLKLKSQLLDATFGTETSLANEHGAVRLPPPQPLANAGTTIAPDAIAQSAIPATAPSAAPRQQTVLRHLVATDAVTCQMTDEGGKKQNVECSLLTMDTATSPIGKLYPKKLDFFGDGHVDAHAFDETQDIHAGQIGLTFVPTTQPIASGPATKPAVVVARSTGDSKTGPATQPTTRPVELETMTAVDRVRVKTTEGAFASAERLYIQMIEGQPHARLTGKPDAAPGSPESLATVIDAKKNVIIGPTIISDPKQNIATVEGPGSMHLIRQDNPTDKPRPVDVVFRKQAIMDSPDNVIDIQDVVSIASPDPDGTINTATGKHVHITLAEKLPAPPATRPTTNTSTPLGTGTSTPLGTGPVRLTQATTGPTTKAPDGSLASSSQLDLMKGKVVTGMVLEQDAVVQSTLKDAAGGILRQTELKAQLIRYVLASTAPGAKGTFIVPVPGEMLVRDHRPPPPAPAPHAAGAPQVASAQTPANAGDPGNSRGATAFQWQKQLTYDEATYTAVFTGDVVIVHMDDDSKEEPARLRADKVVAIFEPRPMPTTKPAATQPGGAPQPGSQMQLKSMTATGNVTVTRGASQLDAPRMDYDPISGWMVATGTPRDPARFTDAAGINGAVAKRIDWNAQTWNVKLVDVISRTGRK